MKDETVTMCIARKRKAYVRVWLMHCIVCACNHHTLLSAPWHHFPSHDQLVCCNIPSHFWTLTECHPHLWLKTPPPPPRPEHFLNLLVRNNIWFWWCSWLHRYSCAFLCVCVFFLLFFFNSAVAPFVRHRLRAHGKYALRQPVPWRRHREEMKKRFLIISVQHDCWV